MIQAPKSRLSLAFRYAQSTQVDRDFLISAGVTTQEVSVAPRHDRGRTGGTGRTSSENLRRDGGTKYDFNRQYVHSGKALDGEIISDPILT